MKYLRIEKNDPETLTTSITYKATTKPNELWNLIKDDEDNLINFIIDEYNSNDNHFQTLSKDDVSIAIPDNQARRKQLDIYAVYCNGSFLLFSLRLISESEKILEEIRQ